MSVTIRLNCDSADPCGSEFVYSQGIAAAFRSGGPGTGRWEELSTERLRELAELSAGWSTEVVTEKTLNSSAPTRTTTYDYCKEHTHG